MLPAAHSDLISAGPVAVHLSGHNQVDANRIPKRKEGQQTAANM